jgi:hypothetical protein
MANYKEQSGAFSKWIRAGFALITNKYGKGPSITYAEQEIRNYDGTEPVITNLNGIKKGFDPAFTFPLYDSVTGEIKGSATEMDYYEMGASHYLATAALRDAGSSAVEAVAYPRMFPAVSLTPVLPDVP